MRFFGTALFAVATLASIVSGQASGTATAPPTTAASPTPTAGAGDGLSDNPISAPTAGDELTAGKPVTIIWSPTTDGTITLRLRKGDSDNLDTVQEIIKDIPNSGTYTWTPSSKLEGDSDYAIEIIPESGSPNYTPKFSIDSNGKGLSSSTTSTATTLSTSTTSTTSSSTTKTTDEAKETETVTTTAKSTKTTTSSASTKTTDAEEEEEKEAVPNTNSASGVSSPLALVLCLAAAVAYLN